MSTARQREHALTAELAEDKKTFVDAMNADLDEFEGLAEVRRTQ